MTQLARPNLSLWGSVYLAVAVVMGLAAAPSFAGTDRYVNFQSADPVWPFVRPEKAARTIMDAMSVPSVEGDTIHVYPGTYTEQVVMNSGVTLRAEGKGEGHCPATITWSNGSVVVIQNCTTDTPTRVINFRITGGRAPYGGGIHIEDCKRIRVESCCIENNRALVAGGGASVQHGEDVTFQGNEVTYNLAKGPDDNDATDDDGSGGGLFLEKDSETITITDHNMFDHNEAVLAGGAIYVRGATNVRIDQHDEFTENKCRRVALSAPDGALGGAIACSDPNLATRPKVVIDHCRFWKNRVVPGIGGAIALTGSRVITRVSATDTGGPILTSSNNVFDSNEARGVRRGLEWVQRGFVHGGAVDVKGFATVARFEHDQYLNNQSDFNGGAAYVTEVHSLLGVGRGEVKFFDCQLYGNQAGTNGGAIEVTARATASIERCRIGASPEKRTRAGAFGGGVHVTARAECGMTGSVIEDCEAGDSGGGVSVRNATLAAEDCTIQRSTAEKDGGGLFELITDDRRFSGFPPGFQWLANGNARVSVSKSSSLLANQSNGIGGAIAVRRPGGRDAVGYEESLEAVRSTIDGNDAGGLDQNGLKPRACSVSAFAPDGSYVITSVVLEGSTVLNHQRGLNGATISCFGSAGEQVNSLSIPEALINSSDTAMAVTKFIISVKKTPVRSSAYDGLRSTESKGRIEGSGFFSAGQNDIVLRQRSYFWIRHCELNGGGSGQAGVVATADSQQSSIRESNITGHSAFGVLFNWDGDQSNRFEARQNWWGSPSGPNTTGADRASPGVDYSDWASQPIEIRL